MGISLVVDNVASTAKSTHVSGFGRCDSSDLGADKSERSLDENCAIEYVN